MTQVVARNKLRERISDQLFRFRIGLRKDLGILDEVERIGDDFITIPMATQSFQSALPDLDTPDVQQFLGHTSFLVRYLNGLAKKSWRSTKRILRSEKTYCELIREIA